MLDHDGWQGSPCPPSNGLQEISRRSALGVYFEIFKSFQSTTHRIPGSFLEAIRAAESDYDEMETAELSIKCFHSICVS